MHTYSIHIDTPHAAFDEPSRPAEVAALLRTCANIVEQDPPAATSIVLRDVNGNRTGSLSIRYTPD